MIIKKDLIPAALSILYTVTVLHTQRLMLFTSKAILYIESLLGHIHRVDKGCLDIILRK